MEMRDEVARSGKMWASQAAKGREGWSDSEAVWLERMEEPSGRATSMPGLAGRTLVNGALEQRKCPEQPLSRMAGAGGGTRTAVENSGGEEASGRVNVTGVSSLIKLGVLCIGRGSPGGLAVPLSYVEAMGAVQILSEPPWRCVVVASSRCPGAFFLQVALV